MKNWKQKMNRDAQLATLLEELQIMENEECSTSGTSVEDLLQNNQSIITPWKITWDTSPK